MCIYIYMHIYIVYSYIIYLCICIIYILYSYIIYVYIYIYYYILLYILHKHLLIVENCPTGPLPVFGLPTFSLSLPGAVLWPVVRDGLGWFKGKSTGNHGFYHQIWWAFRFQFSHHPILWKMERLEHYVEISFIFLNFPHLKMCTYMHRCVHTWIILNVYLVLYIYDLLSYR